VTPRRIAAYVLDVSGLFVVLAPLTFGLARILYPGGPSDPQLSVVILLGFSVPTWAYFTLSDSSTTGATLGKKVLGIRVTACDAVVILPFHRALARTAAKLLPWELAHIFGFTLVDRIPEGLRSGGLFASNLLALIYLAVLFASSGRRTLHDFVASTEVVPARGGPPRHRPPTA
jgi:uncharacterized RDD family membrane protein YckC